MYIKLLGYQNGKVARNDWNDLLHCQSSIFYSYYQPGYYRSAGLEAVSNLAFDLYHTGAFDCDVTIAIGLVLQLNILGHSIDG